MLIPIHERKQCLFNIKLSQSPFQNAQPQTLYTNKSFHHFDHWVLGNEVSSRLTIHHYGGVPASK